MKAGKGNFRKAKSGWIWILQRRDPESGGVNAGESAEARRICVQRTAQKIWQRKVFGEVKMIGEGGGKAFIQLRSEAEFREL